MDFHFLVVEKSWKINVEKEGAPCFHRLLYGVKSQFKCAWCTAVFSELWYMLGSVFKTLSKDYCRLK